MYHWMFIKFDLSMVTTGLSILLWEFTCYMLLPCEPCATDSDSVRSDICNFSSIFQEISYFAFNSSSKNRRIDWINRTKMAAYPGSVLPLWICSIKSCALKIFMSIFTRQRDEICKLSGKLVSGQWRKFTDFSLWKVDCGFVLCFWNLIIVGCISVEHASNTVEHASIEFLVASLLISVMFWQLPAFNHKKVKSHLLLPSWSYLFSAIHISLK